MQWLTIMVSSHESHESNLSEFYRTTSQKVKQNFHQNLNNIHSTLFSIDLHSATQQFLETN